MISAVLIALLFASWGEEHDQAIREYTYLYGEMFSRGWFSYTESGEVETHPSFIAYVENSDYEECVERAARASTQFTMYTNADEVPESLIAEYTAALNAINAHLAGFMEIGTDQMPQQVPVQPWETPADSVMQASFSTANITAEGDQPAIDRIRFNLQNLQGFYDTISGFLDSGDYTRAMTNIDNMRSSLTALGEEVATLRGEHRLSITFHGLPGDHAVETRAEMERQLEDNRRLWEYAQNTTQELDDAIYGKNLAYIRLIWHTSCQSMLDWHSPPDWFQVPSTFLQWYNDSQERADAIQGAIQMMNALRQTRNEFDRIRFAAEETHREILEALEDTEPLIQLHNDMGSLFRGLSWAAFAHD